MSTAAISVVGPTSWGHRRGRRRPPRAALVEAARPRSLRGGVEEEVSVVRLRDSFRDRADDMQAEAAAMARAADASVYSAELISTKYGSRGRLDQNQRRRAANLRNTFTRLGLTFVKIGQGLSTRPDLCPPLYIEELSQLQDALPTFPDEQAFSCIERELGCSLDSVYSSISASPIAAASLGQVYKARLNYSGQVVAVKVQRPGIEEAIGLDFYLIRGVGFLINKYVDIVTSDVVALVDESARRVYQELNYVQKGQNARRFKKLYADKADVLVPDIFWDYTSGKVLTMEWVEGMKLNEQEAIERQGLKVLDLVNTGIQCSLRQLLEYDYFHADPHPGNLLATPDGKLAFLDFGMMSENPEQARSAIIGHVIHMVNRDYEAMARDYYALDFLSPDVDVTPIVPALRNFFDDALNSTVSELNFKTIVDGLGSIVVSGETNLSSDKSLTVLEGLALYTDPNFKVLAASYPYFAKRLLTDPNPYLRDALIELLFKDGRFRHGRKDTDFNAKDALQPVLKLLLWPDGEELQVLVIKEAIQVTEAIVVGSAIESYKLVPDVIRTLVFNINGTTSPFVMNSAEQESMMELRAQVFRIWELLRSSDNFDPSIFQPIYYRYCKNRKQGNLADVWLVELLNVWLLAYCSKFSGIHQPPLLQHCHCSSHLLS
ncbi:hypothetical protein SASPL_124515 [Salvia splendens]|uniref:Protein kinase domain-containing protein n=1 Tax=Salvia splendens TaxID=180675 RepID=A0A8X8XFD4_SALSN|nr:hypothetical protein SASPL_124515 [Salvia splendens]